MADMSFIAELTRADVQRAAGRKSYDRAQDYLAEVADLEITAAEITATVRGHRVYDVRLQPGSRGLAGTCSCPQGQEGLFCKHCAAVGLVALKDDTAEAARARSEALAGWLQSLSRPELLAELSGLLDGDRRLRRRFELRVAARRGDAATVRWLTADLDDVRAVAEAVTELTDAGAAREAVEIAQAAIERLAVRPGGDGTSVPGSAEAAGLLLAAHLRACQAAPPEPGALGRFLAGLLRREDLGPVDAADYAGLLGEAGLASLRAAAISAHERDPGDGPARRALEAVLRAAGDVDGLVGLHAGELDQHGRGHLRIARELDQAGRGDDALDWAERGLRESSPPSPELIDYLAGRYAADGRAGDVLALRRDRFAAQPTLDSYRALRRAAHDAGAWPAERERGRRLLRADAERARFQLPRGWAAGPVLIDALLDDGDPDDAWTEATGNRAVTPEQWLRLADAIAADRPADALEVYRRAIDQLRTMTGNDVYHRLASLLLRARDCHQALGTGQDFRRYLAAFRTDQRRKRSLMRILAEHGL
jgi:tetratricopeptide (TPR) repeat protein